jgi:hypothetical protein
MNNGIDQEFIDLEPYLGSLDFMYTDLVKEIIDYPYALESGYFDVKDEFKNHASRKAWDPEFKDLVHSEWSGNWTIFDRRITLVKNTERHGIYFPGKPWDKTEQYFQNTWSHLNKLPIEVFYRTLIILGSPNNELPVHSDWTMNGITSPLESELAHTVFINPFNNRSFYYMKNGRRVYTNSSVFTFDQRVPHGISADSKPGALIRIYCKLTDDLCDKAGMYRAKPPRTQV